MKLISAKYLADQWIKYAKNEPIYSPNDVLESIDSQPYFDVEPVVHAHWDKNNSGYYRCSKCSWLALEAETGCLASRHYEQELTKYCPHCGAKMDEVV